jgi:hypothetical protein
VFKNSSLLLEAEQLFYDLFINGVRSIASAELRAGEMKNFRKAVFLSPPLIAWS